MTAERIPDPKAKAKRRRVLDLDAIGAELAGEPLVVRLRGKEFTLPASMPVGLPIFLNRGLAAAAAGEPEDEATLAAVECLFGDRAEEAMRAGFSLAALVKLATTYGVEGDTPEASAGVSSASAPSSKATGTASKRTSRRTTGSTSGKPSLTPVDSESGA